MLHRIRWAEILSATRNCLTLLGAIVLGAWFATKPAAWPLAAGLSALVLAWWACYRLAVVIVIRRTPAPPMRYARIRRPGKRAVASWANFVADVRAEKASRQAGW